MRRTVVSAAVVWLSVAGAAAADGWRPSCYPAWPVVAVPVVRYYYYCEPVPILLPTPIYQLAPQPLPYPMAAKPFAQPTPAPPSQTKEPPLDKSEKTFKADKSDKSDKVEKKTADPPKVLESKSFILGEGEGDIEGKGKKEAKSSQAVEVTGKGVCEVGFWNITGKDVTIRVEGKSYQLLRDRNLTLTLRREFSWQLEGQAVQTETVTNDKKTHDVVLR